MKVRGRRRCTECDTRWSYFETGSPSCPSCGSLRSVSVEDERTLHTDSPVDLDLSRARSMLDEQPLRDVAEAAQSAASAYVRSRGFVADGELRALDDTVLAAAELRYVADAVRRQLTVDDSTELYFLSLLSGAAAGDRPDAVSDALRAARGLATAECVAAYRRDLAKWLAEHPHPETRSVVELVQSHEKRLGALDGEVPPAEADALVAGVRELGDYLREEDEGALARAEDRLSRLG